MTRGLKPVRLRGWTGVPEACAGTFTLMHTPCAENRSLQHTPQSRAEGMFVGVRLRRRTHWSPDVRALHPLGEDLRPFILGGGRRVGNVTIGATVA